MAHGLHQAAAPDRLPGQPLPRTQKVGQGLEKLNSAIQVRDAIGKRKRE